MKGIQIGQERKLAERDAYLGLMLVTAEGLGKNLGDLRRLSGGPIQEIASFLYGNEVALISNSKNAIWNIRIKQRLTEFSSSLDNRPEVRTVNPDEQYIDLEQGLPRGEPHSRVNTISSQFPLQIGERSR